MKIGQIVSEKRKEKGLTQQELADFVGVSKASVSKWENDMTYPDITLLPLLAAFFDITMDQLLDYHSQLTTDEIKRIYQLLQKSLLKQSSEEVLHELRRLTRSYYSCYPFVLQMGLFILNHLDYFLNKTDKSSMGLYIEEARELFLHVKQGSKDAHIVQQACDYEAYTLLALEKSDAVLELLGEYVPSYFPRESLIANAFQQKGEIEKSDATYQSAIAQYLFVMMSGLTNYLQLLVHDLDKFQITYLRGQAIAEAFELDQLHPISWFNFQISAATGFAQLEQKEIVLEIIAKVPGIITTLKTPLVLHGDAYFNRIDPWLEQLELGPQLPREASNIVSELLAIVLEHPAFFSYQEEAVFQKIKQIKEQLDE